MRLGNRFRYSTLKPVRWILRSLIKIVASVPGTTYGETAEMAGKGPCGRCVGHSVSGGEVPKTRYHERGT